jgi:threonine synthase
MAWPHTLQCFNCNTEYPLNRSDFSCDRCGGLLEVRFKISRRRIPWRSRPLSVWKYEELLPVNTRFITTLGEGGTGLHHCPRLGRMFGLKKLYVKNEGENPTGSFKDRGMTVALSKARELGKHRMVCASTGNTSASLSAYSARSGLECIVLIPRGKIAAGKMVQVMIHGAKIFQIDGDFDQAMKMVLQLTERRHGFYLMNSINPFRLEGQKTLAFEVNDQLNGKTPDVVVLPVGNGGNISALWKGFTEFQRLGAARSRPRMIGIQASGAAPIAEAVRKNWNRIEPVSHPQTVATAIRIGSPVNWTKVLRSVRESNGTVDTVTDKKILDSQKTLASKEGIFVEPASAASIAGLKNLRESGEIDRTDLVVCVTTGHGLKDPSVAGRLPKTQGYTLKITEPDWIQHLERLL